MSFYFLGVNGGGNFWFTRGNVSGWPISDVVLFPGVNSGSAGWWVVICHAITPGKVRWGLTGLLSKL